jgi:hypothetical protein
MNFKMSYKPREGNYEEHNKNDNDSFNCNACNN